MCKRRGLARRVGCGGGLDDVQYSGEAENFGGFSTTLYGDTAAKRDAAKRATDRWAPRVPPEPRELPPLSRT